MNRFSIILILLIVSSKVFGVSFPEYPLFVMIEKSDFIVHGYVIDTFKTDSITKSTIENKSREMGLYWTGYATNTAKIKIIATIKGDLKSDTILIPYKSDSFFSLPDYNLNDTIILFLDNFNLNRYFGKTDARYGVKSSHLDLYLKFAKEYQALINQPDSLQQKLKFDWLVRLACSSHLTWEGTEVLKKMPDSIFDMNSRQELVRALLDFKTLKYKDENLIEIVSRFGYNPELILLYIDNLELILKDNDKNYYLSIKLMRAIYKMDSKREFNKLIKKYWKYSFNQKDKQIEVIKNFVERAKKHYAQHHI